MTTTEERPLDFLRSIVDADVRNGKNQGQVVTRFPPEPNGYLHLGHAKSIYENFSIAARFGGRCHLRFDDTNPVKEEQEFIDAIQEDVRWLGYDWGEHLYFASDYFEQLYQWAVKLIEDGKAFVCDLTAEEMRRHRGTLTEAGRESPHRDRSIEENLDLFARMRAGEFPDGSKSLRAKIDMASPNMNLRDPVMYRILRARHPRTGDAWCIYPTYDYTHGQSDSIEGITHSICTLEFEDHRPLYDWYLDQLGVHHPQQIEFARLNMSHMVTSKRKLRALVEEGHIDGWDDPRLTTVAGMRRRGYPPEAIRAFCEGVGVSKRNNVIDMTRLEFNIREHLNRVAPRVFAVLDPIKLVVTNYPEGETDQFEAVNNPEDEAAGTRPVPFSRELLIERSDFREDANRKFHRLAPGREVRLRYAYLVTCTGCVKNDAGEVVEVHCTYDPETRGGSAPDGRKVKGTIHWLSAAHAVPAEVRLYDRLFTRPDPESDKDGADFRGFLNPESLVTQPALVEPSLAEASVGDRMQFERTGYFCVDPDSKPDALVFNRTVALRDSWAKIEAQQA